MLPGLTPSRSCKLALLALLQGALAAQSALPVFEPPEAAPEASWELRRSDGAISSVRLDAGLPGLAEAIEIPFSDAPRRLRVLMAKSARTTLVAVGGVRTDFSFIVLRSQGEGPQLRHSRCTVTCAGGRSIAGFERPWIDSGGDAMILLYRDEQGVQIRAHELGRARPRPLLARRLARVPESLRVRAFDGEPRVQIDLGDVPAFAPGAQSATEAAGEMLHFLHPRAALPQIDRLLVDLGALAPGTEGKQHVLLRNPGALPMRLELREEILEGGGKLRFEVQSLRLAAGASRRIEIGLSLEAKRALFRGRLAFFGPLAGAGPLAECALVARRAAAGDVAAPVLDTSKVETKLLPGRRARILAVSGALSDASGPCKVSHISGASVDVGPDGAFTLEVPLGVDRRVRIRARDARGNVSEAFDLGVLRDTSPPRVDTARIALGLPARGRVWLRGRAAAISDDTPPLRVRARITPGDREALILVRADGSFAQALDAAPGDRVSIVAQDGAAPLNRGREILVGRVYPYLSRYARGIRLHAPPFAKVRIECLASHVEGEPAPVLRTLDAELGSEGSLRIAKRWTAGAQRLRVRLELLSGRPLRAELALPK